MLFFLKQTVTKDGKFNVIKHVSHTNNYRHWSGAAVKGRRLEPLYYFDNKAYCARNPVDPFWTSVGYAPKPMSRLDYFKWDILNGLLMKYGLLSVIVHAANNWNRRDKMIEKNRQELADYESRVVLSGQSNRH